MSSGRLFSAVLCLALLAAMLGAGFVVRWKLVAEYPATAGDGLEYHRLAHELRREHRYAYGPDPLPLSYARPPGYPMLLTLFEHPNAGDPKDLTSATDLPHLTVTGTRLNVYFDLATALLVFLIARAAGLGIAAWLACAFTLACPLLLLDCCYLLRETFSTALTTLDVALLVFAWRRRSAPILVAAGAVLGVTMLVRPDAITLAPAFLVPLVRLPRKDAVRGAALALLTALLLYAPWPIRNQLRFHEPHPFGAAWVDYRGTPLPTGFRTWMSTWIDGVDQGYLNLRFVFHGPIAAREVNERAYDSPAEETRLRAIIARYNREELSPEVDRDFHDLAWQRIRDRPFYCLLYLPARRAALWWWHFPPQHEQPLTSALLDQPARRDVFERASHAAAVLGALGWLVLLARRRTRDLAWLFALALVTRSLLMAWLGPDGGYQRYLAPVYPLLLIQAAVAVATPSQLLVEWLRPRAATPPPR